MPTIFKKTWNPGTRLVPGVIIGLIILLAASIVCRAEMPVLGARSKDKEKWIRGWMGVKDEEIVEYCEVEGKARELAMRNIVSKAVLFPLSIIKQMPVEHHEEIEEEPLTNREKLLQAWQDLSEEGKADAAGLLKDLKTIRHILPETCVQALRGNINQAPPLYSRAKKEQREKIDDDVPVGLLVDERSRFVLRDRISWKMPPKPGANLRIRDLLQYGDQLELEFKERDDSEEYRFRMLMPVITKKHPDFGMDASGRYKSDEASFVWDNETQSRARKKCVELIALSRFYWGDTGSFFALGPRLAQIDYSNDEEFEEDWEQFNGFYNELIAHASWNYSPADYDPDTLFPPGAAAEFTLRIASEYTGSPVSYEILEANYRLTTLITEDLMWDMEFTGSISDGVPGIMLPTMGGDGTVRGHGSVMSADRMICLQQTIRRSYQWLHNIVFTPSAIFDIGIASQKSLENERRNAHLEGIGAGIRWDFPDLYGFKMLEFTFAQGVGLSSDIKIDVNTKFEF